MIENWSELVHLLPELGLRVLVSVLCGFGLGLERELREKPAGLRTILLITVGSTLYMIVSSLIPLMAEWPSDVTRADPSRIASQVVSGIGFLGAGTIIQARGALHGLTTAAVIWVAAGIGLCAGIGFPVVAIGLTLIVLATLVALTPLRAYLARRAPRHRVTLRIPDDAFTLQRLRFAIDEQGLPTTPLSVARETDGRLRIEFSFHGSGGTAARLMEGVARVGDVRGTEVF